jgi:ubiquinone/menaquinone biosynthesis C-methylase UbiE
MKNLGDRRFNGLVGKEYDLFRAVIPHYDEAERKLGVILRSYVKQRPKIIFEALELGFGTGLTTQEVMNADPRIRLTAIDSSPGMLDATSKKLEGYISRKCLSLNLVDISSFLRKNKKKFDAVVSGYVLHNIPGEERERIILGIYDALNEGGIFVNLDVIAPDSLVYHREVLNRQFLNIKTFDRMGMPQLRKEWEKHYKEDASPGRVLKEGVFVNSLRAAGFKEIHRTARWNTDALYWAVR